MSWTLAFSPPFNFFEDVTHETVSGRLDIRRVDHGSDSITLNLAVDRTATAPGAGSLGAAFIVDLGMPRDEGGFIDNGTMNCQFHAAAQFTGHAENGGDWLHVAKTHLWAQAAVDGFGPDGQWTGWQAAPPLELFNESPTWASGRDLWDGSDTTYIVGGTFICRARWHYRGWIWFHAEVAADGYRGIGGSDSSIRATMSCSRVTGVYSFQVGRP